MTQPATHRNPGDNEDTNRFSQPPYPEPGFAFDTGAAVFVKKHEDLLQKIFMMWAVYVLILILLALAFFGLFWLLEYPWLVWVVMTLLIAVGPYGPILLVILFVMGHLQLPRARCSGCGKKMARKWSVTEGGKYLFLICTGCWRYLNTGLSSLLSHCR